jgi:hypothetical protein
VDRPLRAREVVLGRVGDDGAAGVGEQHLGVRHDVNETGNIAYTGNWGATAGISGQSGCSASTRSCPASYVNSGPTYAGNAPNVSVPSLVSTWTAGDCGDVVANSTEPTSAASAQAVVSAAGLEAAYADLKNGP